MSAIAIGGGFLCLISLSGSVAYALSSGDSNVAPTSNTAVPSSNVAPTSNAAPSSNVAAVPVPMPAASSVPATPVPTVVSPPAQTQVINTTTPAQTLGTNTYITIPPPPPPAPASVKGFVPVKTVTRRVTITPNSPTAPTPGDLGVADGTPLGNWNIPELKAAAFLRFNNSYVFKVRNTAYYNFYGYFINSSGTVTAPPFTSPTAYTSFEIGNFYS